MNNTLRAKGDNGEKFVIIHDNGEVIVKIDNHLWRSHVGTDFSRGTIAVMGVLHEEDMAPPVKKRVATSSK
jgi:formylmethanofuran dehydrogenase subunit C